MSKGGGQQTQSTTVDPATQQYVDYMRRVAMGYVGGGGPGAAGGGAGAPSGAASPFGNSAIGDLWRQTQARSNAQHPYQPISQPLPAGIQQAMEQYGQYARGGNLGFSALTGNAGAQGQFMNPYLSQMNPFFAQQRQQAVEGANQQATLAGAFGGDRSQIGAAQAGNFADQTHAGFTYQAFNDAMQRALQSANLGFGAIGAGAMLPQQYQSGQLNLLQQALGPYGQTQTQPLYQNRAAGALGGAATGFGMFGPLGALGGGILGALG